jgi:hypothetical protein
MVVGEKHCSWGTQLSFNNKIVISFKRGLLLNCNHSYYRSLFSTTNILKCYKSYLTNLCSIINLKKEGISSSSKLIFNPAGFQLIYYSIKSTVLFMLVHVYIMCLISVITTLHYILNL